MMRQFPRVINARPLYKSAHQRFLLSDLSLIHIYVYKRQVYTIDGSLSAQIEYMVHITETGVEVLAK